MRKKLDKTSGLSSLENDNSNHYLSVRFKVDSSKANELFQLIKTHWVVKLQLKLTKMYHKRKIIIGAAIIYLILLISFFVLRNVEESDNDCGFTNTCIRFCCQNKETCNESFIHENFNDSHWLSPEDHLDANNTIKLRVYLGEPTCHLTMIDAGIKNTLFSTVSLITQYK